MKQSRVKRHWPSLVAEIWRSVQILLAHLRYCRFQSDLSRKARTKPFYSTTGRHQYNRCTSPKVDLSALQKQQTVKNTKKTSVRKCKNNTIRQWEFSTTHPKLPRKDNIASDCHWRGQNLNNTKHMGFITVKLRNKQSACTTVKETWTLRSTRAASNSQTTGGMRGWHYKGDRSSRSFEP